MGIVIAGRVDIPPSNRDAALAGAQPFIAMALAQAGCRHYAWTADPHLDGRVHVFEEWDTAEHLSTHLAGPAYRGMLTHLGGMTILAAETLKYRFDLKEPVYRADGIPNARFLAEEPACTELPSTST